MIGGVKVSDRPARRNRLVLAQIQQVHNRPAATLSRQLRQLMDLPPVHAPLASEEQQVIVRRRRENVLDRILVLALGTLDTRPAAALSTIDADRSTLDIALRTNRYDHVLFLDQILQIDIGNLFAGE